MALDQVKTQILLLHSEQSTLDNLSAGIDDRYTVHCATTGMEALTTLGATPIHVIISAKDLPGMSGVDALREAKKRSPDTIGILLANNGDTDLEALVGEKEVFQVVRDLKPQDLGSIIDNATQQIRLMALAESANDVAANPDEMAEAEHIVMETSENGSTIISDATGRMRALNPSRISASTSAGARSVDVLVLSKDEEFLGTVRESTAGMHEIRSANTLGQAEESLAKHKVGVVLIDAAMVGSNAEKLAQHLQTKTERLVSVVAGRRDDGDMLMDLINRGVVYRFLLKPVSPGRARLAIEASVKQHLEAPDSAFKVAAKPAAPVAAAKAPPQPPKQKQTPKAKPKPRQQAAKAPPATAKRPEAPAGPAGKASSGTYPVPGETDLSTAFDGDDKSFTETMTGLVADVGDRLKSTGNMKAPKALSIEADDDGPAGRGPLLAGIGVVVTVAIAAGGYFLLGGSDEAAEPAPTDPAATVVEERPEPVTQPEPEPAAEPIATPPIEETLDNERVVELVDAARLARGTGRIYLPQDNNAIDFYAEAVSIAPGDEALAAELAETITEALALAEQALLERRIDDVAAALERIGFADPGNARLPFLSAQLAQLQLRQYLDSARAAIRNGRFESAAAALNQARELGLPDTSEIDSTAAELRAARSDQRVDDVLSRAVDRFESGNLISPDSDNARYYYSVVLDSEPNNRAAVQGLKAVAAALVVRARNALDAGQFDEAEALLGEARALDPGNEELAVSSRALNEARAPAPAPVESAAAATPEPEPETAAVTLASETPPAQEAGETTAAETQEPEIVGISALKRTRYVAPRYPRAAERRNTSGWVDVVFTVTLDGSVRKVEVRDSEPEEIFDSAAVRAVERWEFEPVFEDGIAVEKRAGVRLMFAIE